MPLAGIKIGDIVRVDKKGRLFLAEVVGKEKGKIKIIPLRQDMFSYREATAHEVVAHWSKRR